MGVIITKEGIGWSKVVMSPSVDGNKDMVVNHTNVVRVRLLDIPEVLDMVNIHLTDSEVLELHYSFGVVVDGVTATSNTDLYNKIVTHLTT